MVSAWKNCLKNLNLLIEKKKIVTKWEVYRTQSDVEMPYLASSV